MTERPTSDWMSGLQVVPPAQAIPLSDGDDSALVLDGITFPREASARIRAMSASERAAWDADRFKAKTDQLYLSEILGLDLVETPHRALFAQFLQKRPGTPLAELDGVVKKRMILWPRGHAKTVSARVEQTQLILNYPNIRICFLTGGDDLAKRQLRALKEVFEKPTERFKYLFPEFVFTSKQNRKTGVWMDIQDALGNAHEFTVPCRTSTIFAEPTFAISTAKSVKAGSHFDFIFIDDLVNDQNYRSAKSLEKCYEDYLGIVPLLEPTGYIIMTGTRYSFGDTYERIQENAKEAGESSVWSFSIRDCWSTGCKNCKHAEVFHDRAVNVLQPPCTEAGCTCAGFASDGSAGVLFPQVRTRDGRLFGFTLDSLHKLKAELGASFFANQYENSPLAAEEQIFTETMIGAQTIFEPNQLPTYSNGFTFLVGDLAYSEADERDLSVIYTVQKYQGQLFVTDCAFGRWGSNELVETTIRLMLAKRPNIIYFEKPAGPADSLLNLIRARAAQVGLTKVPIEFVKASNAKGAKGIRISNIQAALMSKRLWLFAGMPGYEQLVQQLVRYPRVKHDDFADCLARVVEAPTAWAFDTPPQVASVSNWLRKLHASTPVDDDYYDSGAGSGVCC